MYKVSQIRVELEKETWADTICAYLKMLSNEIRELNIGNVVQDLCSI